MRLPSYYMRMMPATPPIGPTMEEVTEAARRLKPHAYRTPFSPSRPWDARAGGAVFLKCENLQRVGALKFRGAYNAISQLTDAEKACGVIAFSSGNHAQAVALVGKLLGVRTVIVMPDNAPATKRAATVGYGAEVIIYDPTQADRKQIAESLSAEHGYTLIPPYDHAAVLTGQGTAALELIEEVGALDCLLTPVGGGGLLSGCAIAAKGAAPDRKVIGVEPELADDATRSFRSKTLHTVHNPPTIADGTRTPSLGTITFPLVLEYVDDFVTVSEEPSKTRYAMPFSASKSWSNPPACWG